MSKTLDEKYNHIRSGGTGYYEQSRGLIAVWGKEAVQFLDGLITNDMKTLEDGGQMLAAFPNAQGRLLAVVRVRRNGDKFLFETEEATRDKVFQNLFRFTFAGDFFVEDLSEQYQYVELFNMSEPPASAGGMAFTSDRAAGHFIPTQAADGFRDRLLDEKAVAVSAELYEILRIENGIPKYGVDMDDTTIVPELGLAGLISYNKGCYIGQEIIARIHFRGHVAKQLTGLVLSEPRQVGVATGFLADGELSTVEGKNAGRVTSSIFSPGLNNIIALAYVRYDYLADGTELMADGHSVNVVNLPFIS